MAELGNSSSRGMFIDSCYTHCQTGYQQAWLSAGSPVLDKTVRVMILSLLLVCFNILMYCWFPFLMIENMFYTVYCKGSGRLVLRQKSIPKDWLPLPLQPIARKLFLNLLMCTQGCRFVLKQNKIWESRSLSSHELDWVRRNR